MKTSGLSSMQSIKINCIFYTKMNAVNTIKEQSRTLTLERWLKCAPPLPVSLNDSLELDIFQLLGPSIEIFRAFILTEYERAGIYFECLHCGAPTTTFKADMNLKHTSKGSMILPSKFVLLNKSEDSNIMNIELIHVVCCSLPQCFFDGNQYLMTTLKKVKANNPPGISISVCTQCSKRSSVSGKKYLVCGKCKTIHYCSTECQKIHWPQHKLVCRADNSDYD